MGLKDNKVPDGPEGSLVEKPNLLNSWARNLETQLKDKGGLVFHTKQRFWRAF
jgi:hypothetical protein